MSMMQGVQPVPTGEICAGEKDPEVQVAHHAHKIQTV